MIPTLLAVALGGALGAILRAGITHLTHRRAPWGTLAVNWAGSALLGWLLALNGELPEWLWLGLAVGLCGALTTFSTCILEAAQWWRQGLVWRALAYLGATFGGSVGLILLALDWGPILLSAV
jgi:fluoride exporter